MKIVAGLGNVGEKYSKSRHNVGFMFLDAFASYKPSDTVLFKPDSMMNSSGPDVLESLKKHSISSARLFVVHDDLDLPLGSFKIQFGRGPKVHNGINSVENSLGTPDFWRVRIGIDNRDSNNRTPGEEYVLEDFSSEEKTRLIQLMKEIVPELVKHLKNVDG